MACKNSGCYFCGINLEHIFSNLINNTENIHEWLAYNSMKTNPDKFQFIIVGKLGSRILQVNDITTFQVNDVTIKSTSCVTLPGITIDSKLNFKGLIDSIIQ